MKSVLSYRGRIGRAAFCVGLLGYLLPLSLILALPDTQPGATVRMVLGVPLVIGWVYWAFRCMVLRIHDLGYRSWTILAIGIPILQFVFVGMLLLLKGDAGPNQYGNDPTALPILQQLQNAPSEMSPDYVKALPELPSGSLGLRGR